MDDPTPLPEHQQALDAERAVNERYLREQDDWLQAQRVAEKPTVVARSAVWTDTTPKAAPGETVVGPLIGRVALTQVDPDLGDSFYVGPWRRWWDGVDVVSWAAPVANLFYSGRRAQDAGDVDPKNVAAVRTFEIRDRDIEDFVDDVDDHARDGRPFGVSQAALSIPEAPVPVTRPSNARFRSSDEQDITADSVGSALPGDDEITLARTASGQGTDAADAGAEEVAEQRTGGLRAEELVRKAIAQPRTAELPSVLATLQPDQYRLVTWPSSKSVMVQGHPGSGKTIVATHRAGYLTHPNNERDPLERVALVGPTEQWRAHVAAAIRDVGGQGVAVLSLPQVVGELAFNLRHELHIEDEHYLDTCWELARVAARATRRLRRPGVSEKPRELAQRVVNELVRPTELHAELVTNPDVSGWLLEGRSWEFAGSSPHFMPFFAAVRLNVEPPAPSDTYEHLIVDEAQDVRPLEWWILLRLLRDGGAWSLFGDMHQRRSDVSTASWKELADDLEIDITEPETLRTGYRSTNQILRFASRLLPKGSRVIDCLSVGPDVARWQVSEDLLVHAAAETAINLARSHRPGMVAAIATDDAVNQIIRRLRFEGWSSGHPKQLMTMEDQTIAVLRPIQARGLEFDGVGRGRASRLSEELRPARPAVHEPHQGDQGAKRRSLQSAPKGAAQLRLDNAGSDESAFVPPLTAAPAAVVGPPCPVAQPLHQRGSGPRASIRNS